jgi:hypothetical protein
MKTQISLLLAASAVLNLLAATNYVALDSPNPTAPYTNWATAAHVIQDAVDAALPGDTVLVTNGLYEIGQRVSSTTNEYGDVVERGCRVVIGQPLILQSVNGPKVTVIEGADWGENGEEPVRCVFAVTNAVLSGFTLTNGHSGRYYCDGGGGAFGGTLTNCVLVGNSAFWGGGAFSSTLYNCTLTGNQAGGPMPHGCYGGGAGAESCTLYGCTLTGNSSACSGGGAEGSSLYNCVVTGNTAGLGGGAEGSSLYNCVVTGNRASWGGGADRSMLYNCTITGNWAGDPGGGAMNSILYNCTLTGNWAGDSGGGAMNSILYNCTLTGNSAAWGAGGGANGGVLCNCTVTGNSAGEGGGVVDATLYNCIVLFNKVLDDRGGGNNFAPHNGVCTFNYSCTTPLPPGPGNLEANPLFTNDRVEIPHHLDPDGNLIPIPWTSEELRLRPGSPCIDAGTNLLSLVGTGWTNLQTGEVFRFDPPPGVLAQALDGNGDGVVAYDMGAQEFDPTSILHFTPRVQLAADGFRFTIHGVPGTSVRLERSPDLREWLPWMTVVMPDSGLQLIDPQGQSANRQFYRAVVQP